jgi:hypothetical protein
MEVKDVKKIRRHAFTLVCVVAVITGAATAASFADTGRSDSAVPGVAGADAQCVTARATVVEASHDSGKTGRNLSDPVAAVRIG